MAGDPEYPSPEFWDLLGPLTAAEREEIDRHMASDDHWPAMRIYAQARHVAVVSDLIERNRDEQMRRQMELHREEAKCLDMCKSDEEREQIRKVWADLREQSKKAYEDHIARIRELFAAHRASGGLPDQTTEK